MFDISKVLMVEFFIFGGEEKVMNDRMTPLHFLSFFLFFFPYDGFTGRSRQKSLVIFLRLICYSIIPYFNFFLKKWDIKTFDRGVNGCTTL